MCTELEILELVLIGFDHGFSSHILTRARRKSESNLIALLGGGWFNDSLNISDMESKAVAEKLQGYWILEIGESVYFLRNNK